MWTGIIRYPPPRCSLFICVVAGKGTRKNAQGAQTTSDIPGCSECSLSYWLPCLQSAGPRGLQHFCGTKYKTDSEKWRVCERGFHNVHEQNRPSAKPETRRVKFKIGSPNWEFKLGTMLCFRCILKSCVFCFCSVLPNNCTMCREGLAVLVKI